MPTPEQVKHWIEEGVTDSSAEVVGDGRHFEAVVISSEFSGKMMLEQHRMVYTGLATRWKSFMRFRCAPIHLNNGRMAVSRLKKHRNKSTTETAKNVC